MDIFTDYFENIESLCVHATTAIPQDGAYAIDICEMTTTIVYESRKLISPAPAAKQPVSPFFPRNEVHRRLRQGTADASINIDTILARIKSASSRHQEESSGTSTSRRREAHQNVVIVALSSLVSVIPLSLLSPEWLFISYWRYSLRKLPPNRSI